MRYSQCLAILLLSLLLASCAGVSPTPKTLEPATPALSWQQRQTLLSRLNQWNLKGKIGVQTTQDSGSASMNWQQNNNTYTFTLLAPLGAGSLTLNGQPGTVTMKTSDGKQASAASAEQLLADQWGWHLPVSYLKYWIRGLPVPHLPAQKEFDASHRLTQLVQQSWRIQFQEYMKIAALDVPSRLIITGPQIRVKIVIYQWVT